MPRAFRTLRFLTACITVLLVFLVAFNLVFGLVSVLPTHTGTAAMQDRAIVGYLLFPFFSDAAPAFLAPNERSHIIDVKRLFDGERMLALVLALLLAAALYVGKSWRPVRVGAKMALVVTTALVLLGIAGGFADFWTRFHYLFFPQGNWAFPASSPFIQLYPEQYFLGCVVMYVGMVCVLCGLLLLLHGAGMHRRT